MSKRSILPSLIDFDACFQRLSLVKLPYAPTFVDEGENANFIKSLLPQNAPQMVAPFNVFNVN